MDEVELRQKIRSAQLWNMKYLRRDEPRRKVAVAGVQGLGPAIVWQHRYVTDDKISCIYIAPNQQMIREHAQRGGFSANRISRAREVVDPSTAELPPD